MPKRYTIVLADRQTGTVRRLTIRLRPFAIAFFTALAFPVLVGLGLRVSATTEANPLRASNATLEQENSSYRQASGALAGQTATLPTPVSELGLRTRRHPLS